MGGRGQAAGNDSGALEKGMVSNDTLNWVGRQQLLDEIETVKAMRVTDNGGVPALVDSGTIDPRLLSRDDDGARQK